jgi:hypothetical protein
MASLQFYDHMQCPPLKNPSPDGYESWPFASGAGAASSARVSCSVVGASALPFCCRPQDLVSNEVTELIIIQRLLYFEKI